MFFVSRHTCSYVRSDEPDKAAELMEKLKKEHEVDVYIYGAELACYVTPLVRKQGL